MTNQAYLSPFFLQRGFSLWYDCLHGEKTDPDYHSAIWVPVKRKA